MIRYQTFEIGVIAWDSLGLTVSLSLWSEVLQTEAIQRPINNR